MSNKRTVALNTITQMIGKGVSGITSFIISIILAKSLGVDGYGDLTKITTYVAFFYLFCDFGLNAAYLETSSEHISQTLRHSLFTLRVLMGLGLMFVTLLLLLILPGSVNQGYSDMVKMGIIIFIPSILFQSLITTTNVFFQEKLQYMYATYALIAGSLTSLCIVYFSSLYIPQPFFLFAFAFANLIGIGVTAGIALIYTQKNISVLRFVWKPSEMKQLFIFALPLGITLIFNVIYFHADSFILTISRPTYEVGIYGLAYKFFEFTLVLPTFFMNAVLPFLFQAHAAKDSRLFRDRVKKSAIILTLSSLGIASIFWFASPLLQYIRPEFTQSAIPLKILLLGLPFFYLSSITMWILVVKKLRAQLLTIYGISMICNIVLNSVFIPTCGYIGASWITVLSEVFVLTCSISTIFILDKKQST